MKKVLDKQIKITYIISMNKTKKEKWLEEFNGLEAHYQEFTLLIFPDILSMDLTKIKTPVKLLRQACIRAEMDGFFKAKKECGRCRGSGRYSWNRMDGNMCYGCGGKGYTISYPSKSMVEKTKRQIEKIGYIPYYKRGE